ncbi:hypothetical protein Syun_024130 [Stephania yunnanensis]|uniref:F-box domain-containing protein n=1 Tax=Stephania yunnanensis TaxID=152371 RepID=A0AAP0I3Y5_9MAGN
MINKEEEEEEEEVPLHGELLNTVLSHVPLLHLLSASHVCSGWRRAALSLSGALSKPWLLLHTRRSGTPARAYDPSSHEWIHLARAPPPPLPPLARAYARPALRSSHSTLLYTLSPSTLSFTDNPIADTWRSIQSPHVWRRDPVVARVGPRHVVVAGGTCEFEHDPLAVEVYDLTAGRWDACESMPTAMVGSASATATWLSVAVPDCDGDVSMMCVMEKRSGRFCSLDAVTMRWEAMMGEVRPEPSISHSVIGFSGARLVMMGIMGNGESGGGVEGVGVWELRNYSDCGGRSFECIEIGRMPDEMVGRVRNWSQSVGLVMGRGLGYVYEEEGSGREVVWFEVGEEGSVGEWGTVDGCDLVFDDQTLMDGVVLTCATVTLDDLRRAVGFDNQRFSVITRQESE